VLAWFPKAVSFMVSMSTHLGTVEEA